jgi:hypothetical protein
MKAYPRIPISKLGILLLILTTVLISCQQGKEKQEPRVIRFEKMVFTISPGELADSLRHKSPFLLPFYRIFNEEIIRIGPDSLPGYDRQLEGFTHDSVIRKVYDDIQLHDPEFKPAFRLIARAINEWAGLSGRKPPTYLVTYLSGFNQSFITLPDCLGIGIDNYLGSDYPFYANLGIPVYIRRNMNPGNLAPDAVRAWLYSEIPGPSADGNFLDRMIYEGKIYYLAHKLLPRVSEESLLHYNKEQLNWCKDNEKAMWKFLAEQKVLFSTDRMTVRKYIDEAPFTRDFGNDSPGRTGIWIGYRIVSRYMKRSKIDVKGLIGNNSSREILSGSDYHP